MSQRVLIPTAFLALVASGVGFFAGSGRSTAAASAVTAAEGHRIATLDTLEICEKLFQSEKYTSARDAVVKPKQATLDEMQQSLVALGGKMQAAGNGPDAQALNAEFSAKREEFMKFREDANGELMKLNVQQFNECYRLVVETAATVAKSGGYSHVLSSREGGQDFRSADLSGAIQEVLARPVLVRPAGDDITAAVLKELKLDAAPATPPAADGAKAEPK